MNTLPGLLLIAWQAASRLIPVAPLYPPLAFHGGNIVAIIEPARNADNKVSILHAEAPFVDVVQTALTQWRFPGNLRNQRTLVVVNFRDSDLGYAWTEEGGTKFIPHSQHLEWGKSSPLIPVPTLIVDPLYPDVFPNSMRVALQGSVILHLRIDGAGHVHNLEIIQGIENDFDQAAVEAVKQWKFAPARNEAGKAIDSEAYAVCVYRALPQTEH